MTCHAELGKVFVIIIKIYSFYTNYKFEQSSGAVVEDLTLIVCLNLTTNSD